MADRKRPRRPSDEPEGISSKRVKEDRALREVRLRQLLDSDDEDFIDVGSENQAEKHLAVTREAHQDQLPDDGLGYYQRKMKTALENATVLKFRKATDKREVQTVLQPSIDALFNNPQQPGRNFKPKVIRSSSKRGQAKYEFWVQQTRHTRLIGIVHAGYFDESVVDGVGSHIADIVNRWPHSLDTVSAKRTGGITTVRPADKWSPLWRILLRIAVQRAQPDAPPRIDGAWYYGKADKGINVYTTLGDPDTGLPYKWDFGIGHSTVPPGVDIPPVPDNVETETSKQIYAFKYTCWTTTKDNGEVEWRTVIPEESLTKLGGEVRKRLETAEKFGRWLLYEMAGKVISKENASAQALMYLKTIAKGSKACKSPTEGCSSEDTNDCQR